MRLTRSRSFRKVRRIGRARNRDSHAVGVAGRFDARITLMRQRVDQARAQSAFLDSGRNARRAALFRDRDEISVEKSRSQTEPLHSRRSQAEVRGQC